MKILILEKNDAGTMTVINVSPTNLTDNAQLSLISVGDKTPILVSDNDAHQVGDTYQAV